MRLKHLSQLDLDLWYNPREFRDRLIGHDRQKRVFVSHHSDFMTKEIVAADANYFTILEDMLLHDTSFGISALQIGNPMEKLGQWEGASLLPYGIYKDQLIAKTREDTLAVWYPVDGTVRQFGYPIHGSIIQVTGHYAIFTPDKFPSSSLMCLNLISGELLWSMDLATRPGEKKGTVKSLTPTSIDTILVGTSNGVLSSIRVSTGELIWERNNISFVSHQAGSEYIHSLGARKYQKVDVNDGNLILESDLGGSFSKIGFLNLSGCLQVIGKALLAIDGRNSIMVAIDTTSGTTEDYCRIDVGKGCYIPAMNYPQEIVNEIWVNDSGGKSHRYKLEI